MKNFQEIGKELNANSVRKFFMNLANQIPTDAKVLGSVDANDYGMQCSFSIGDGSKGLVISFGLSEMKGCEA